MKTKVFFNYVLCSALLFVAVALLCGGGIWSLIGFSWCGLLVASGGVFPSMWRLYWVTNIRILQYFDCL